MQDQEKTYKLKNSSTSANKKYGAGVFIEGLRKPQKPKQGLKKVFYFQSQSEKNGGRDCYFKYKDINPRHQGV